MPDTTATITGNRCGDCGHVHTGAMFAGICVGCPCAARPLCSAPLHKNCRCVRIVDHAGPCNCTYRDGQS